MQEILFEYEMHPTTWVYLSSLLVMGIFFKFHRLFSIRNLDLLGLIAFAPGLLLVFHDQEAWGYLWLFTVGGLFLVRLLLDPLMVRRPLLEPNLSASGLGFTGIALLVFLATNLLTADLAEKKASGVVRWETSLAWQAEDPAEKGLYRHTPGYPPFARFAHLANRVVDPEKAEPELLRRNALAMAATRTAAILGLLAAVVGLVLVGYWHFDSARTGVAAASLYLLLPYASQMTGQVDHLIPAALLVWAVVLYRRPLLSGGLVGVAAGLIFYPVFLLPLWLSFYWRRGVVRFAVGVVGALVVMVGLLAATAGDGAAFAAGLKQMAGWPIFSLAHADGFWEFHGRAYRIPIWAAYVALCGSLALWPAQKHLGALLSCSAAVMLGTQFWQAQQGGLHMAWYLPLLVLVIFRPNLEDRLAVTAVADPWLRRTMGRRGGKRKAE
jgi:hypothetical protein